MSARVLYLHIGPPKTGTSAVQSALMRQDRILYPEAGRWWDGAHHNLVFNFFNHDGRADVTRVAYQPLFEAVAAEAKARTGDILISSEALWDCDIAVFLAALRPFLPDVAKVQILAACREHLALAASLYSQRVKDGHFMERRAPDALLVESAAAITYRPVLERLEQAGFALTLLPYHPAAGFVARFFAAAGLEAPAAAPETHNVSLSIKGLVACLAANRVAPTVEIREELYQALQALPGFWGSSAGIFSAQAVAATKGIFDADRDWLAARHGIVLPAPPQAAPEGFSLTPAEGQEILAAVGAEGMETALAPFLRAAG